MAEVPMGPEKYASNSQKNQQANDVPDKKVEKVIEGSAVQRKKPLGRRIAENFKGEDAQSVGHYVLFQVVLPQLKDMIFDVGSSALQRMLFGDAGGGRSYTSAVRKGFTPYNTISGSAVSKVNAASKPVQAAASDEFGEIMVETRGEAQEVMDKIGNLIETYSMASVADLKAAVGLTGNFTDEKFGWVGMGGTDIRRVGGAQPGYVLIFPRPEELK